MIKDTLMQIENLGLKYYTRMGWVNAISDVSMEIRKGEILGLVGESGCGKSTLGKALMRLNPDSAEQTGKLWFKGQDLMKLSDEEMRAIRGQSISMIFQDPMTSLNPIQNISDHMVETILTHEPGISKSEARQRAAELVDKLGITHDRLDDYPHQLSGGMRQRVMIGLALSLNADLIIADEATTSLDVIVEAQFIELLRQLRDEFDLTVLLITHNIGLVAELADRVVVMYAGRVVEQSDVFTIFSNPKHPYTNGLLGAIPNIHLDEKDELYKMEGTPPDLIVPPAGCRFHPRCPRAMPVCAELAPTFNEVEPEHWVNCWLYEEIPSEYRTEGAE